MELLYCTAELILNKLLNTPAIAFVMFILS